ncbi:MAG: helix-turn-helix transcriptional regulator [Shimia sp.]|nr:helix-turn-helix transcriptional regulator [Shimia sp.]
MTSEGQVMVLPNALNAFSFNREILSGRHGIIMHKTVHEDLREVEFVSTQSFICYLIGGRERFFTEAGDMITLTAGDLIAIPKHVRMRSDFVSNDGPLQAILVFCSDRFLHELVQVKTSKPICERADAKRVASHPSLTSFMKNMVDIYGSLSVNEALVHSKMSELIYLVDALDGGELLPSLYAPEPPRANGLRHLVERHAIQGLSSTEMAALTGRSLACFNRDFRRVFGTSYRQWQIDRRIEATRELLVHTDQSITQIALENGYDSVSYFIEQFQKVEGVSPLRYRKALRS